MVELHPHQQKAVDKMHNGCVLWGIPGSGKSITALAYFVSKVCKGTYGDWESMRTPRNVYVITPAKKRDSLDWEKEALRFHISTEPELSISGIKIVVDSWNNIDKYVDVEDAFFIFDEQRLVGSGAWTQAFVKIAKKNEWVLLSATPGDTWLDYIAVFVANGFYSNRTEFKREHVVYNTFTKFPKVDRYVNVGRLVRLRNQVLVHMPYQGHTVRHDVDYLVSYDTEVFRKVVKDRWHVYKSRPLRDVGELFTVMRKVANSDASRLEAVASLLKKHPKLIVFYNFDYELETLRRLSPPSLEGTVWEIPIAEWNGHKHEPIPNSDRWIYLVQYMAGGEAWNCIETDAMVFYSLTYSYKMYQQAHGRIDRLNTPFVDLWYYTLRSTSWIDQLIWKKLSTKQSFNESAVPISGFGRN